MQSISQARGSSIVGNNNVSIAATGENGEAGTGDITMTGASVMGKNVDLWANNDVTMKSAQSTEHGARFEHERLKRMECRCGDWGGFQGGRGDQRVRQRFCRERSRQRRECDAGEYDCCCRQRARDPLRTRYDAYNGISELGVNPLQMTFNYASPTWGNTLYDVASLGVGIAALTAPVPLKMGWLDGLNRPGSMFDVTVPKFGSTTTIPLVKWVIPGDANAAIQTINVGTKGAKVVDDARETGNQK
jgi:hypothetical protein